MDYKLCNGIDTDLKSNSFDRVFMVSVIGDIENNSSYLKEIYRIMKDDGILSVSELAGDLDKLSMEELQSLIFANGFTVSTCYGTKRNYTINFNNVIL